MPGRILVVDDADAHRDVMGSWLRGAGFDVVEAATGSEALAKLDGDIVTVVLDVDLPDMSGFEVCAAIKRDSSTATLPVMHVSATAIDLHSRAQGLDGGAEAYLIEPLDVDEFLATVRALARAGLARRRTDRLVGQLRALAAATVRINRADSLVGLLEAVVAGAAAMFDAPAIAGATLGDGRVVRCATAGPGAAAVAESPVRPSAAAWPETMTVVDHEQVPASWQAVADRADARSDRWCIVPVRLGAAVTGGLGVGVPAGEKTLSDVGRGLLGQLAATVQVALDNLRAYTAEHRIALTLQRALLPRVLPSVPGLTLEARYFASGEGISVGGDFYDVFELDTGQTVAVVGDVQGHSLHAATVMAELRFSLRAYLGENNAPGRALDLLDNLMRRNHPEETATVALVLVQPDLTALEVASAGHLPPLLVTADGARFVEHSDPLLGVGAVAHDSVQVELTGPTAVVLVTDGLIERRAESIDDSLDALRETALSASTLDPVELADALVARFVLDTADDDIAVLVVRIDPPPAG